VKQLLVHALTKMTTHQSDVVTIMKRITSLTIGTIDHVEGLLMIKKLHLRRSLDLKVAMQTRRDRSNQSARVANGRKQEKRCSENMRYLLSRLRLGSLLPSRLATFLQNNSVPPVILD
jgi:hypothetical protein